MATELQRALSNQANKHSVGNLVSTRKHIQDLANGALYVEDVDNFHLVEIEFSATSGEPEAKYLTDNTIDKSKIFLSAGMDGQRFNAGEEISGFFNGVGEKQRVVYLTQGLIFDTSAFELDATVTEVAVGNFAHYNPATKKFVIHDGTNADYANASVKFVVRRNESETMFTLGQPMVRLIVL